MRQFLGKCVHHAAWRAHLIEHAWSLVEKELQSPAAIPWPSRPGLWRRGFLSEAAVIYRFGDNDPRLYLSDYARVVKTCMIDDPYGVLLDDKLLFAQILRDHALYLPIIFGTLTGGRIVAANGEGSGAPGIRLPELLHRERDLVLKPVSGGGGRDVTVWHADDGGTIRVNGRAADETELRRLEADCEGYLVSEYVQQHPTIAALYPATTNTIRIVTMRDDDGVFIAATILRIGCERSRPTDNWSRGGMTTTIDLTSGRLGRAASYSADESHLAWHVCHPESGARIEGTMIPHWQEVTDAILDVARSLPFLPYIGWDVVVTEDGFRILEGNKYPDVHILQVHRPLLADDRIRAFYRRHGVIGGMTGEAAGQGQARGGMWATRK